MQWSRGSFRLPSCLPGCETPQQKGLQISPALALLPRAQVFDDVFQRVCLSALNLLFSNSENLQERHCLLHLFVGVHVHQHRARLAVLCEDDRLALFCDAIKKFRSVSLQIAEGFDLCGIPHGCLTRIGEVQCSLLSARIKNKIWSEFGRYSFRQTACKSYSTECKNNPRAGAVGPAAERFRAARIP